MNKEERFEIQLNQEDVQNIINCYEKDIKLIKQIQQENKEVYRMIKRYEIIDIDEPSLLDIFTEDDDYE